MALPEQKNLLPVAGAKDQQTIIRAIDILRRDIEILSQYLDVIAVHEAFMQEMLTIGPQRLAGQIASYYVDNSQSINVLPPELRPPYRVILTSDVIRESAGVYKATVRPYKWNGTEDMATGFSFEVFETERKWRHALEGDCGEIAYHPIRNVHYLKDLNTPLIRYVTLDEPLARDAHVSGVDVDTGQAIEWIAGTYVKADYQAPTTGRHIIKWFPFADAAGGAAHDGDGVWRWAGMDDCLEEAAP